MDDHGHIGVLVNPASRRGAGAEHAAAAIDRLVERGATVRTYRGDGPQDTGRLARDAVAAGPRVLAVVGGDGTIAAVLPHVVGTGVPLAVLGGGTGNDLARMHGIPSGPRQAADVVLDGVRRLVDTGTVTADDGTVTSFATIACAGFDSRANQRINALRHPKGAARYTVGTYLEFLGLRTFSYRLVLDPAGPARGPGGATPAASGDAAPLGDPAPSAGATPAPSGGAALPGDPAPSAGATPAPSGGAALPGDPAPSAAPAPSGEPLDVPGHLLAIGNTRYYGGGRAILPRADAADGLLDVTLVGAVGRLGLLALDRPIRRGEHLGRRGVRALRATSVRVDADEDLIMYADGEPVGPLPVTVTAHHRTLMLCLPRDGGRP